MRLVEITRRGSEDRVAGSKDCTLDYANTKISTFLCEKEDVYKNIHSNIIHSSKELKTTSIPINSGKNNMDHGLFL